MALSERERERNPTKLTEALVLARTRASDLESVRKLNCWASQIRDASIVRKMPNLEVCSLSVNNLSSLEDFSHCPNLQELYIRKNRVQSLSDVHYLKGLDKLRVLWLSDNPCSEGDSYRMTVLKTLPNLQKLDNVVVTEDEVNRALEEGEDLPLPPGLDPDGEGSEVSTDENASSNTNNNHYSSSVDPGYVDGTASEDGSVGSHGPKSDHLKPEISQRGPSFGASAAELHRNRLQEDSVKLSWEETNHIRAQLGLKPLPVDKVVPHKSVTTGVTKARNANILQAVLLLIRELDKDSLEIVHSTIEKRLEDM
ncbi:hypothetical protein BaRGS_00013158 [Batillaria attramentaria]|uniref:U2A'/phosphoprotein 32 family A C-terminal domain-containing protein n=1 Tax=Batillaria attramentaria TaxID=370345 RepID=A0ABD0L8W5_9CAEN